MYRSGEPRSRGIILQDTVAKISLCRNTRSEGEIRSHILTWDIHANIHTQTDRAGMLVPNHSHAHTHTHTYTHTTIHTCSHTQIHTPHIHPETGTDTGVSEKLSISTAAHTVQAAKVNR